MFRVARPCAQHRSGREATRSLAMRTKTAQNLSFGKARRCASPAEIGRVWRSLLSLRDPAALPGRTGPLDVRRPTDKWIPLPGTGIWKTYPTAPQSLSPRATSAR